MNNVIEVRALSRRFGHQLAVDDLSLDVTPGQVYGFLGRNGAGKTTTLRLMLGLLARDCGSVSFWGMDLDKHRNSILARVGALIEFPGFYGNLSARRNLEIFSAHDRKLPVQAIESTLRTVGLAEVGPKKLRHYSLGMKQRLGIARALLHDPDLLILDEPTNGLDPSGIKEIRDLIKEQAHGQGKTVLVSSHLLGEVEQMADTIGIIHHGRMLEQSPLAELQRRNGQCIVVRLDDPAKAGRVLEGELAIKDLAIGPDKELRIYEKLERSAQINRCLVLAGLAVEAIHVSQDNLEDYFLRLTSEEAIRV